MKLIDNMLEMRRSAAALGRVLLVVLGIHGSSHAATPREDAVAALEHNGGAKVRARFAAAESYLNVHAGSRAPLLRDDVGATPVARAKNFLNRYPALLGLKDANADLVTARLSRDATGTTHVHLDQRHNGLPVFGARIVVHMNDAGILGISGTFVDGLDALPTTSRLPTAQLQARAMTAARKLHPQASGLGIESSRLLVYRNGLLKGVDGKRTLALEAIVTGAPGQAIRDRIFINANSGAVLNVIDEIHTILNRKIYTPLYRNVQVLAEGQAGAPVDPPLTADRAASVRRIDTPPRNLYTFAGGTWRLYKNLFGRDGYDDGADGITAATQMQESVYLINQRCPNAYWDGISTNYCPGFDADDVVSHEWSHAYTEYTHGLIYQYQSGALNESYSDIFGEAYDLLNGIDGPLGANLTEGQTYDNRGSRWVIGEDLSEPVAILLLRDMWDPDAFPRPSPGSVISSPNYFCDSGDNGGVHVNSGVPNHAFAMLVDGKTFNGVSIPSIGLVKALHIYFQAATHYQTPTTNFAQHADALERSCADLLGQPLNGVDGQLGSERITAADCRAVAAAMGAVEMRLKPNDKCGYKPVLQPESSTPALCGSGLVATPTFRETWESGSLPSGWTQDHRLTGDSFPSTSRWAVTRSLPAPHTGHAVFAPNNTGGTCKAGGDQSSSFWLDSPALQVQRDASYLSFTHFMQTEAVYDGGNLKASVNAGAFTIVPPEAFVHNGHSSKFGAASLVPLPPPLGVGGNNSNPLAGEAAWSGTDEGENFSSWGTTIVDVGRLGARAGDRVRFRWEFGNDCGGGNLGWYVDDTQLYYCATATGGASGESTTGGSTSPAPSAAASGGAFDSGALLVLLGAVMHRRRRRKPV
ncbi:MAG: M4 family metallopeptidase [Nevskia sp.]|nr:M4 family metallopeptidase [Nevskia sp.]